MTELNYMAANLELLFFILCAIGAWRLNRLVIGEHGERKLGICSLGYHSWSFVGYRDDIMNDRSEWEAGEPPLFRGRVFRCKKCQRFKDEFDNPLAGMKKTEYFNINEQREHVQRLVEAHIARGGVPLDHGEEGRGGYRNMHQRGVNAGEISDEATEKAWKLLEGYMQPNQYFAFMEKPTIELQNHDDTFRLLINKDGEFTILEGGVGVGIVASSGRIKSYDYPLGDEIAVFIDWFKYKTKELIAQWNCGTYGIVKEGQRG